MAGDPRVDLIDEALSEAADYSTGPLVTQHSTSLGLPNPEAGESLLFRNSDEELEYLRHKYACLEKQRRNNCL
jgi:hypothetical protein